MKHLKLPESFFCEGQMKNLILPEHYEVGDLVQTIQSTSYAGNGYWLPEYENILCIVTHVDWGLERLGVVNTLNTMDFDTRAIHPFKRFKLIQKNHNKLIKLVYG